MTGMLLKIPKSGRPDREARRQARLLRESNAVGYLASELVACEAVEREDGVLVYRTSSRSFLVEIKVHEVTDDGR